ncbi:MAG: family 78 glycoside hydrolase catalytic domain [Clostridia bacterium]|nr:family 78 glycoside hydrolase catalytic domain [Clostridia bacterium]
MDFPQIFYKATDEFNTYEKHVNAPLIRKVYETGDFDKAEILVSGLGFYDLFVNGKKITKGLLAPYISNPDDIVCFDSYDVTDLFVNGKNTVGLILGNGMQNAPGGRIWDFDSASFRNAPCFAFSLTVTDKNGEKTVYEADTSFKCKPSAILFDDIRSGCFYDANLETDGWLEADFDDSDWAPVKKAENPRGERRLCEADPIVITEEIKPVKIFDAVYCEDFHCNGRMVFDTPFKFDFRGKTGKVFDFGINTAGIFRLKLNGRKGQKIYIATCEYINSKGEPANNNIANFYPADYCQAMYYVCRGEKDEIFEPSFSYYGCRYAVVFGLDEEQITEETLVMLRANSDLRERGNFECSDPVMNALRDMSRVSDLANFYYFPTDCPHREKNGWTGDAAVSCERVVLTLTAEKSYREWLRNICKAQRIDGALPGIIPTGGWGFRWGNGPAWDNVLTELCWQIYRLRGDLTPARECSESILRYLSYISQKRRPDGLIAIGLGDWLQPMKGAGDPTAPLEFTDSVISMYICRKAAALFKALGLESHYVFAAGLCDSFRAAIRENLVDFATMTVKCRCQTAQACAIYYGVFDDCEKPQAGRVLLDLVHEKGDHFDCGMIGMRVIFHVLSDLGEGALAYKMITRKDYPSYGCFIDYGYTALPEDFRPENEIDFPASLNHHFFGDIVSWFIQRVAGIRVNPKNRDCDEFEITPDFIESLSFAKAYYDAPCGTVKVEWNKEGNKATLKIECPEEAKGTIRLPIGWTFVIDETHRALHGSAYTVLKAGEYRAERK